MASSESAGTPALLETQPVLDVVELETERLKARVAQALSGLQNEAYSRLQAQLAAERRDFALNMEEKDERLRVLELESKDQQHLLESAVHKMLNIAGKSGERYKVLDGIRLCRSIWREWTRYVHLARRERRFEQVPETHYGRVLFRKVLGGWRTAARKQRGARTDEYWRAQVAAAQAEVRTELAVDIEALQLQLSHAKEQLRIGAEERDALEEELKRAFMRGVCALNMEAVSILRHGGSGIAGDATGAKRVADNTELRTLQAQTGEAMLELSKYGPAANSQR